MRTDIDITPEAVLRRKVSDAMLAAHPISWFGVEYASVDAVEDLREKIAVSDDPHVVNMLAPLDEIIERMNKIADAAIDVVRKEPSSDARRLAEEYRKHRIAWASAMSTRDLDHAERARINAHFTAQLIVDADALIVAVLDGN